MAAYSAFEACRIDAPNAPPMLRAFTKLQGWSRTLSLESVPDVQLIEDSMVREYSVGLDHVERCGMSTERPRAEPLEAREFMQVSKKNFRRISDRFSPVAQPGP